MSPAANLAELAYYRGQEGRTFATHDEATHPIYNPAYTLGAEYRRSERVVEPHVLVGCGCPRCRLNRIIREHGGEAIAKAKGES